MTVDSTIVTYLENLARIRLTDTEREKCTDDLQRIISYFDELDAVDTEDVLPLSHAFEQVNITRLDEVLPSFPTEAILQNAPRQKDNCFLVQRTVE
ncbi:MAG: Asp-tRNA(Asn)/Glu-tRNA(Gln) amidotransferase subunit GatC [Oscillospiraceae bacterium]|nr:Asp-tRNA(Asn)/Glu-tRNA(Gln) amidotransferase subunit GatC [Oscillospiraceae bacterium]